MDTAAGVCAARSRKTDLGSWRLAFTLLGAFSAACGGDEAKIAAGLGGGCVLNSDCAQDLVCIFKRCHEPCRDDGDCLPMQRCVKGSRDTNVCQLPDELECDGNGDCNGLQVCTEDNQCRDLCQDDDDCIGQQQCGETSACFSPSFEEDPKYSGSGGKAGGGAGAGAGGGSSGHSGDAGDGGRSGSGTAGKGSAGGHDISSSGAAGEAGGESGSGGSAGGTAGTNGGQGGSAGTISGEAGEAAGGSDDGGSGGVGGNAGGTGGTPSAGVGGEGGVSGSSGTGAAGTGGSSPLGESEPNDQREAANQVPIGTDVYGSVSSASDYDYFEFEVPATSPAGGYVIWSVSDVNPPTGSVTAYSYSVFDNGQIDYEEGGSGESLLHYFATVAGGRYRVAVKLHSGTTPFSYVFRADYHPISDSHEANEVPRDASNVTLDTEVNGYLFAGYHANVVEAEAFDDWYVFTPDAPTIEVSFRETPADVKLIAKLYDPDGSMIDGGFSNSAPGLPFTSGSRPVTKSGTHLLHVTYNGLLPRLKGDLLSPDGVPDYFKVPYKFTIGAVVP